MNLSELQYAFIKSLHGEADADLLRLVNPNKRMSSKEKLAVYQNTAKFVLLRTLEQIYPICLRILGTKYFRQIAKLYVQNHPSEHSDLNVYGNHLDDLFAELLRTRNELKEFSYLSDLAKLEMAYHKSYYALDNHIFNFKAFEDTIKKGKQNLSFQISEATLFIQSEYPILEIWRSNRENTENAESVGISKELSYLCVYRVDGNVQISHIEENAYRLVQLIKQNLSLEKLAAMHPDVDTYLPDFIRFGWIDSFCLSVDN